MASDLKLSKEQRQGILAGKAPSIRGKGICPVERGQVVKVTSRVSIKVDRVRYRRGGGWSLAYTRVDFRELYLMPSNRKIALDDYGQPLRMSDAEAHGMNTNQRDPIDAGAVLDARHQTVVTSSARLRRARQPISGEVSAQVRSVKEQLKATLDGLSPEARAALLANVSRAIAEAQRVA